MAKPSAEFVAGVLASWFSGGVAVPLALSYPETELLHVMNDSVCPELACSPPTLSPHVYYGFANLLSKVSTFLYFNL